MLAEHLHHKQLTGPHCSLFVWKMPVSPTQHLHRGVPDGSLRRWLASRRHSDHGNRPRWDVRFTGRLRAAGLTGKTAAAGLEVARGRHTWPLKQWGCPGGPLGQQCPCPAPGTGSHRSGFPLQLQRPPDSPSPGKWAHGPPWGDGRGHPFRCLCPSNGTKTGPWAGASPDCALLRGAVRFGVTLTVFPGDVCACA